MSHLKNETFLDWFLKCKIVLLVAPKVVPFLAPSNLQQGDRTTLTCTVARGDSPLTLMWKKDGLSLSDLQIPSIKIINFDEFNSMLTIESLHKLHIGNYSCAAVNSAGQSAVSTRINVQGINIFFFPSVPPVLAPFSFGTTFSDSSMLSSVLTLGARSRVLCGLTRGDPPVSFSWLKDGHSIEDAEASISRQVTITLVDDFSSLLTIPRLGRGHAGNYTCLASNEAGTDHFTAILHVQGDLVVVPHYSQKITLRQPPRRILLCCTLLQNLKWCPKVTIF